VRRTERTLWVVYLPLLFGLLSASSIILKYDRPWVASKEFEQ
jgi:hypothetical protein